MKPTIGRIVHYTVSGGEGRMDATYPALITSVDNESVSLYVIGVNTTFHQLGVARSEEPKPGCWNWPARIEE